MGNENMNEQDQNRPQYWQDLEEWRQSDEFKEMVDKEFQSSPFAPEDSQSGFARRDFLKLMGASMAMTSAGCLRRPEQRIVPYANRPPEILPGRANYYSSSLVEGGEAFGLVVKTREGRPIKLEGNPDHPFNEGSLSARGNAYILALYDPDRLTGPKQNLLNKEKSNRDTVSSTFEEIDKAFKQSTAAGKLGLVTRSIMSPSTRELISEFVRVTGAKHYVIDDLDYSVVREGQKKSYGQEVLPRYRLDKAQYVLTIDTDLLGSYLTPVEHKKMFSKTRNPEGDMSKLVSFESLYSMTGSNADERFRIRPSEQIKVVVGIISELINKGRVSDSAARDLVNRFKNSFKGFQPFEAGLLGRVADELWANRGKSVVAVGGLPTQTGLGLDLQVATNYLNSILGNDGKTIDYERSAHNSYAGTNDIERFVSDVEAGRIESVLIHGVNPAYSQPNDSGLVKAIKSLKLAAYTGAYNDETGQICRYLVPDHNQLENWGDVDGQTGTIGILQPTIRPLYKTRAFQDTLLTWVQTSGRASGLLKADSYYDYLRSYWRRKVQPAVGGGKSFEDFWYEVLQTGVVRTSEGRRRDSVSSSRSFRSSSLNTIIPQPSSEMELVLYPSVALGDGSLANIPWLQELPDPVSKIVWDNYISISPAYAHEKGIHEGDVLDAKVGEKTIALPAHIQPGMHDAVAAIAIGYGRMGGGKVAEGIGKRSIHLASYFEGQLQTSGLSVELKKTKKNIPLASPQGHHRMEGRQIVVQATQDQYKKDPAANIHKHKVFSLWGKHEYKGHRWALGVDLNACNGCGDCVVACQSENNVPTVGKKYVMEGRIMHWIRIDRYYSGDPSNPAIVNMPVMCQHCENAPCETVCPVNATVHGDEGTNDMIYNRCVGTRYCANNCPYKVRRFNWFNYVKQVKEPQHLAMNPEVTVRARGVMEKCTFCNHRVKEAKMKAKTENRPLAEGDVQAACAASCGAGALIFGDINDPNSKVSQHFNKQNGYSLLEELNAVPMVKYTTKIRNTSELKLDDNGHGGGH